MIGGLRMIERYRGMLNDRIRIQAFREAIRQVVQEGDVVVEIGTGLGTFSMFAAMAGAKKVYAIERTDIIELAEEIADRNGFSRQIHFLKGNSLEMEIPEEADVVIAEDFGSFFVIDGLDRVIRDAQERFLKPEGTFIPAEIELHIVPLDDPETYRKVDLWAKEKNHLYGIDFSPTRPMAVNNTYKMALSPNAFLCPPQILQRISLSTKSTFRFERSRTFLARRKGRMHGLGGWFNARLSDEIVLRNAPDAPSTLWKQVFFPLERAIEVEKNAAVDVTMRCLQAPGVDEIWWSWQVTVEGASWEGSTFRGFPLSRETLERRSVEYVPALSPSAAEEKFVLEALDGRKSIRKIGEELHRAFPKRYRDVDAALLKVSRIIKRLGL